MKFKPFKVDAVFEAACPEGLQPVSVKELRILLHKTAREWAGTKNISITEVQVFAQPLDGDDE